MINVVKPNAQVFTTPHRDIQQLHTYISSVEMARQNFARRNGFGVLLYPIPGSCGDLSLVEHADGSHGCYWYDEMEYVSEA